MRSNISSKKIVMAVSLCLSAIGGSAIAAEDNVMSHDPARWSQPDTTRQARFTTMSKEAGAGYQLWLNDCKPMRGKEAADCRRKAKENYDRDMQAAKAELHGNNP